MHEDADDDVQGGRTDLDAALSTVVLKSMTDGAGRTGEPVMEVGTVPVVAARGVWDDLASVVVLYRDDDGELLDDTHLLQLDSSGQWVSPGSCSGSGMPEWVLRRPADGSGLWAGAQIRVLSGQVAGLSEPDSSCGGRRRWVFDGLVMCSQQVAELRLVHRTAVGLGSGERELTLVVPVSGLVTVPCPLGDRHDSVLVVAIAVDGEVLGQGTYSPLTDVDRGWPDAELWPDG